MTEKWLNKAGLTTFLRKIIIGTAGTSLVFGNEDESQGLQVKTIKILHRKQYNDSVSSCVFS